MDETAQQKLSMLDGNINALEVTVFQYQTDLNITKSSSGDATVDQQLMQEGIGLQQGLTKVTHRLKGLQEARKQLLADNPELAKADS